MICFLIRSFVSVLFILIRVALITLFERKILALSQFRLGPNKIILKGILQPVLDGIKLFQKRILLPFQSFKRIFILGPRIILRRIIILWRSLSSFPFHATLWIRRFLFLLILRAGVYGVFLRGLGGASKYSFIGGIRACIQRVRYEIRFALIILALVVSIGHITFRQRRSLLFLVVFPIWGFRIIAETNRAPFDLAEGERELIRGFNLELGRVFLAFVFVGEYGIVIAFAWLTSLFFFRERFRAVLFWVFLSLFFRRVLPRFRYDKLLSFCWTSLLPPRVIWILFSLIFRKF